MPQIKAQHLTSFQKFLKKEGVRAVLREIPIKQLIPIQKKVNMEKVKGMQENKKVLDIPPLVSKERHITDGHHRCIAKGMSSKNPKTKALICMCPTNELLEYMRSYNASLDDPDDHGESPDSGQLPHSTRPTNLNTEFIK